MAALDLATKDDLAEVLAELRRVREALAKMSEDRAEEPLTIGEAAKVARVSRRTMQRWVRDGVLPSVAVGRVRRVRRSDLSRLAG
jgi:excisionase family DNA binding protein